MRLKPTNLLSIQTHTMDSTAQAVEKIQSVWRSYYSRSKCLLSQTQFHRRTLRQRFQDELQGYHMLNEEPVKESTWEELNRNLVKGIFPISCEAHGNHKSGMDNQFGNWGISNKTATETKKAIKISSYRLTTVCDQSNPGNENTIKEEIEKRDSSYDYYSLLGRIEDKKSKKITYKWYMIPKTCKAIDPCAFPWSSKVGLRGKKQGKQVGWQSQNMEISFAMSSQLWLSFPIEQIQRFCVCETTINLSQTQKITYAEMMAKLQTLKI